MEEAKKIIPRYTDIWTDHNWSDPGITIIDLFAWLTEMELYRVNLVNDKHKLKYLKLLGTVPEPSKPAKVDLTFESSGQKSVLIKKGDEVYTEIDVAGNRIIFEIDEDITIAPVKLMKVIVDEGTGGVFDRTDTNEKADMFFAPFGLNVQKGCALYLGFDESADLLSFICYLYEKDIETPRGRHNEESDFVFKNADLRWEISASSEGKEFEPVEKDDRRDGFEKSGKFNFKINKTKWKKSTIPIWNDKENKNYYWLRCVVEKSNFEYPPRIETIILNTISAKHGKTITDDTEKRVSTGLPHWSFELKTQSLDKTLDKMQVLKNTIELEYDEYLFDWTEISEISKKSKIFKNDHKKLIDFLECKFNLNLEKNESIEINRVTDGILKLFVKEKSIFLEYIPENKVILRFDCLCYELMAKKENERIKVYASKGYDNLIWKEVDDFDGSGSDDNHFVLDTEKEKITFGDGSNGRIPPAGSSIKVIQYRTGGGEEGNIRAGCEWKIKNRYGIRSIINKKPASGGTDAEKFEDAALRFQREMKVPYTTVTSSDFEEIAIKTPGLRVARAKAKHTTEADKDGKKWDGVTIAIIPFMLPAEYIESPPVASPEFLNAICRHIDEHRLLGTVVQVKSAGFVKVNVSATISISNGFSKKSLDDNIKKAIRKFLDPIRGGRNKNGWEMGRSVMRSELYETIDKVYGVNCVKNLTLSGDKGAILDGDGNLKMPSELATVYPGNLTMTIISDYKCEGY